MHNEITKYLIKKLRVYRSAGTDKKICIYNICYVKIVEENLDKMVNKMKRLFKERIPKDESAKVLENEIKEKLKVLFFLNI